MEGRSLKFPPRPITGDMAQMIEDMRLADPEFETPRDKMIRKITFVSRGGFSIHTQIFGRALRRQMGGSITLDYYQTERPSMTDFGHQPVKSTVNHPMPDSEPNPFKRHKDGPYIPVEPNPYAGLGMGQGEPRRPLFTIKITDK